MSDDIFDKAAAAAPVKGDIFDQVEAQTAAPSKGPLAAATQATKISPQPKSQLDFSSPVALGQSLGKPIREYIQQAESLTPEGASEHPIQNLIGKAVGFFAGGNQGIGTSQQGILTNPVTSAIVPVPGMKGAPAAEAAISRIPNTARAGELLNQVKAVAGDHPIDVSEAGNAALRAWELGQRGGGKVKAIEDFVRRVAAPEKGPLTFSEARDFYSNLKPSVIERLSTKGSVKAAVAEFKVKLGQALEDAAQRAGKLEDYQQAMKEYRRAALLKGAVTAGAGVAGSKLLPFATATEWLKYRLGAK